jgi:hypothetical protein
VTVNVSFQTNVAYLNVQVVTIDKWISCILYPSDIDKANWFDYTRSFGAMQQKVVRHSEQGMTIARNFVVDAHPFPPPASSFSSFPLLSSFALPFPTLKTVWGSRKDCVLPQWGLRRSCSHQSICRYIRIKSGPSWHLERASVVANMQCCAKYWPTMLK